MDYSKLSKDQLLQRVQELQILSEQLLEEKEQETKLEYAWTGNLGHWYWNVKTNDVTFNSLKLKALGYAPEDTPKKVEYQFFTDKIHEDDYQATMDAMRNHLYGKAEVYEAEYRIRSKDGQYKWFYDRGKITRYDESGKPLFLAGIVFDITEKKMMQVELEAKNVILEMQSSVDGLTEIMNHRALMERMKEQIALWHQKKAAFSIALFDLDAFKNINDTKGHIAGDKVLKDVAKIIQSHTRSTDMAGRYGGEEFLVIFRDAELEIAATISERIRCAVEQYSFEDDIKVTISGGVKEYGGESISDFIDAADHHLYAAKRTGKNKLVF